MRPLLKSWTLVLGLTVLVLSSSVSFAATVSPSKSVISGVPGQTLTGEIKSSNTASVPKVIKVVVQDYNLTQGNFQQYVDEELPRGLKQWLTLDQSSILADPSEDVVFKYTIQIPQDVAPGSYRTALLVSNEDPDEAVAPGMTVGGKVVSSIHLTIEGEYNEDLAIENFGLNERKFLEGGIVFDVQLKNLGDVDIAPKGEITIFDKSGTQIQGVFPIVKEFDGQEVVTERKDAIPVNISNSFVSAGSTKTLSTAWTHRQVDTGEYLAKLVMFYGENDKKLESEVKFEIIENFAISDLSAETSFKGALPINFNAKIINAGNTPLNPKGYFEIKNIFGSQKLRKDIPEADLALAGGDEKSLDNLSWDSGFAFGLYNATLNIDVEGKIYSHNISFWILSWWQGLIILVVLLVIVFALYKGIHGYSEMKKKLKQAETKN